MGSSGSYVSYLGPRPSASGKTSEWDVVGHKGVLLGHVAWFGRWRKYVFFPSPATVFEQACLREIANFLERETREQREKWKARRRG